MSMRIRSEASRDDAIGFRTTATTARDQWLFRKGEAESARLNAIAYRDENLSTLTPIQLQEGNAAITAGNNMMVTAGVMEVEGNGFLTGGDAHMVTAQAAYDVADYWTAMDTWDNAAFRFSQSKTKYDQAAGKAIAAAGSFIDAVRVMSN